MTKTDDVLLELDKAVAEYLKSIPPFRYKNKIYRLIDNYVAVPYMKCNVCGVYPTLEISVIESNDGKTLRVGSDCIDNLTGKNVSEWFRNFRKKRESVIANRKYIDQLPQILTAHETKEPSAQITEVDVEKLKTMLEQIYNGLKLTTGQEQLADCYTA